MASVRDLKRNINSMIYDVVDECYSLQLYDESKTKKTDDFIDEAAEFQEEIMAEIKKAENKKDYKKIKEKAGKVAVKWTEKLNKLNTAKA